MHCFSLLVRRRTPAGQTIPKAMYMKMVNFVIFFNKQLTTFKFMSDIQYMLICQIHLRMNMTMPMPSM